MSTFELFLQLPLFKGLEKDDLFSLIPKINLDFEHYKAEEVVFDRQMEPHGLVYLLSGQVFVKEFNIEAVVSRPGLLSFTGLFGLNRQYKTDVKAKNDCSVLSIDTKSLLFLLRTSPVFLSNYLDLISDTIDTLYFEKSNGLFV